MFSPLFLEDDLWQQPVTALPHIGPARATRLAKLGIVSWADFAFHLPRTYNRYVRGTNMVQVNDFPIGAGVIVCGRVADTAVERSRRHRHLALESAVLRDETGTTSLRWFVPTRGPLPPPRLNRGDTVVVCGTITVYGRERFLADAFVLPEPNAAREELVVPVYPLTARISQRLMRQWHRELWQRVLPDESDVAKTAVSQQHIHLVKALRALHMPVALADVEQNRRTLAWEEIQRWQKVQRRVAIPPIIRTPWPDVDGHLVQTFFGNLPYPLTKAQQRAVEEIRRAMAGNAGMRRLLSGDVGTGKSLVIAYTLLRAVEQGGQGVLVVPTRILARQHHETLQRYFSGLGVDIRLLTADVTGQRREDILGAVASGRAHVVVGTIAALDANVQYDRLLVGVIDEQHRFGVEQRLALDAKRPHHAMWVSATPIPKSMAAVMYGATPISFLDERPPGRVPIDTRWIHPGKREEVYRFLHKEVHAGGRGFVVCPVIEEDKEAGIPGAVQTWQRLKKLRPGGLDVELVHGRLTPQEQEDALQRFVSGDVGTLVATSMVEVGVDVPAASVMIIQGAERFGLAQLHQLRGRVGRGQRPSYFIVMSDSDTGLAAQRLQAIRTTTDGFELAESDLLLRGPGEFSGMQQSGASDMRFADLAQDVDLFRRAFAGHHSE